MMKRVYVAGAYSADNVIGALNNMRRGMRKATEKFLEGWAPFCPWMDFHYQLMLRDGEELTVDDYYQYSLAWLDVSDLLYVINGWENSKGTIAEIRRAQKLNIPIEFEDGKERCSVCLGLESQVSKHETACLFCGTDYTNTTKQEEAAYVTRQ